jgi:chaperonin GroES
MSNTLDTIRPLGDRVLIRKIEEKERMFGSIYIPQTANEIDTAWVAEVKAVGPGRFNEAGKFVEVRDVKPGDRIVIGKYMGTEVKIEDQKYYVVRADDILGVIEEAESV